MSGCGEGKGAFGKQKPSGPPHKKQGGGNVLVFRRFALAPAKTKKRFEINFRLALQLFAAAANVFALYTLKIPRNEKAFRR